MPNRFTADGAALCCIRRDQPWSLPGAARGPRKEAVCVLPRDWRRAAGSARIAPSWPLPLRGKFPHPPVRPRRQEPCFDAQVTPMTAGAAY